MIEPETFQTIIEAKPHFFAVGVDLGSVNDSTAICVLQVDQGFEVKQRLIDWPTPRPQTISKKPDLHFTVKLLHRPRLGIDYSTIVRQVRSIMDDLPGMPEAPVLGMDSSGLGAPVVQLARQQGMRPIGITITAGQEAKLRGWDWTMPKAQLVGELRLAMHRKRLKVAQGFAERETLANELAAFTAKLSASGRASFEAIGDEHDDTVLSLALALAVTNHRPIPAKKIHIPIFAT